ncbi:MAG: glycine zipper 2TM domain-containing protein [Magnetospirillum sp.]|nr:glycine zipper 2TM domain-containing protein [Magnetospirillum sp.]
MIMNRILPVAIIVGVLAGCANDYGPKQTGGAVLGGVGGAVAGAQFGKGTGNIAMTALGTLIGAFAGSEVGKSLDKSDRLYAQQAETRAHAVPVGQSISWNNPDSGHSGTYTPTRDGTDQAGNYCREYQTSVNIDGKVEKAFGTACRQPDGSWKVVK